MVMPLIDIAGHRFGHLLALSHIGKGMWLCRCDCGLDKSIFSNNLRKGRIISCGCYHSAELTDRNTSHGMRRTPEYKTWCNIKSRCRNPNVALFPRYGGRGIKVCERWEKFAAFLNDMGKRPSPKHSIDRINNDGNYEPSNCRWATRREQQANMSRNRFVSINGERLIMAEAARRLGLTSSGMLYRLRQQELRARNGDQQT